MTTLTGRPLADIIALALMADCGAGECWAHHLEPCTCSPGVHLARFARACRRGLISDQDFAAVMDSIAPEPHVVFTPSTVVRAEAAVTS